MSKYGWEAEVVRVRTDRWDEGESWATFTVCFWKNRLTAKAGTEILDPERPRLVKDSAMCTAKSQRPGLSRGQQWVSAERGSASCDVPLQYFFPDLGDLYLCVEERSTELRARHLTTHSWDWVCSLLWVHSSHNKQPGSEMVWRCRGYFLQQSEDRMNKFSVCERRTGEDEGCQSPNNCPLGFVR